MKQRIISANRIKYKHLIKIVKDEIKEMGINPATDIRIFEDYPNGWHGVVGALGIDGRPYVYIFMVDKKYTVKKLFIEECLGVRKNGSLRFNGSWNERV